ncbi:hypothetical protein ACFY8X_38835 [Streptomyces tanashiensis]|uniref:hypothetical protein n=1 Tax=Streptomyces tanashiensis TaxID=67367 RepID=UPI0036E0DA87
MPQPVLHTLCALAGVLAGYVVTSLYHRRRDRAQALHDRLIRAGDTSHHNALRARLAQHRAEGDVITAATDTVDAAYARLTHDSQEGGPTP